MGIVRAAAQGAVAGFAATGAMSGLLAAAYRRGKDPLLPPKLVTRRLLPGGRERTPRPGENAVTVLAHAGFGVAAGAVFGAATGERSPGLVAGACYGLLVWLLSSEGWVPRLTVQPPAHRDNPKRAVTMVVAHLVYGAALAAALRRMRR